MDMDMDKSECSLVKSSLGVEEPFWLKEKYK